MSRKSQTDCFKSQKNAEMYLRYCHSFVTEKHLNYKNIKKCSSKLRLSLALYWSSLLILLSLFMACEIAHFGCNSAIVCILIQWQLTALMRKSSLIHSCTYDQNNYSPSTFWRHCHISIAETQAWACLQALSLLSALQLQHNTHCSAVSAHISSDYAKYY